MSEESCASSPQFSLKRELSENTAAHETHAKRMGTSVTYSNIQNIRQEHQNQVITDQPDEFEMFGRSIAAQLRRMPLYDAIICQEKLQSVITQSRLTSFNTGSFALE